MATENRGEILGPPSGAIAHYAIDLFLTLSRNWATARSGGNRG
ncbi:hypothetical protein [Oxynema aestuarii]|nr:hypothetical protein [Oxynema aestuarii]